MKLEFYFDVVSPASYLAHKQLASIATRTRTPILYKPFFLGGVLKATGNAPPMTIPAKGRYMAMDFLRTAKHIGAPMQMNPHFPMNTLPIQRALIGWADDPRFSVLLDAAFEAVWVEGVNVADPDILTRVVQKAGLSADDFWTCANHPDHSDMLKSATQEAVSRGAFGAPTFFLGDEMFFGQDRLGLIEQILSAKPD